MNRETGDRCASHTVQVPPTSRLVGCLGALAVLLAGLAVVGVADAAKPRRKQPARVGLVQVVAASPNTLTLKWRQAKRARKYLVERSSNLNLTDKRLVGKTEGTTFTLTGLAPGKVYCFRVIAKNSRGTTTPSRRSCKPTVAAQGAAEGPTYRVLSYNLCSKACRHFARRKPRAASLILSAQPDLVGLQETAVTSAMASRLPGFTTAVASHGRWLLYRSTRFTNLRTGVIRLGSGDRYAVWAELSDRVHGGRIFAVNVHLSHGSSAAADARRRRDMKALIPAVQSLNRDDLRVLYLGDWNSHRHRRTDWPAIMMRQHGYLDSFDLATSLVRPNYNSGNQGRAKPFVSYTWGDHLDHLYVDPRSTRVLLWANVARIVNNRYRPLASNHNPILFVVQVNGPPLLGGPDI